MQATDNNSGNGTKLRLSVDLRLVVAALLLVILGMLLVWKPWSQVSSDTQIVEVTGEATLQAVPDEFVFYPSYQFAQADKAAALDELTKKSNEVTAKLKELGVKDEQIKSNSNGYDYQIFREDSGKVTYALQLTVTVPTQAMAQKVQDYLLTTSPIGSVSPQASFSDKKRKQLEADARNEATKDARAKADQMAANLGFKVGKVKSVKTGGGFGVMPYASDMAVRNEAATDAKAALPRLSVQPGENELNYDVTVTYFIR